MHLRRLGLDDLHIDDERSFRHVALYDELKQVLRRDDYRFRAPPPAVVAPWNRVLFLNLTFWSASGQGDVLQSDHIDADVVTHVAWHHLTRRALEGSPVAHPGEASHPRLSADALFLGESIASAFDLYLVGRLLGHAPESRFLETQVPAMAEVALDAGLSDEGFEQLLTDIAGDPDRAFEDLRELLFDASTMLHAAPGETDVSDALARIDEHRFAPLLHHYELSTWILNAKAEAPFPPVPDPRVREIDASLRSAPCALDWLERAWLSGSKG